MKESIVKKVLAKAKAQGATSDQLDDTIELKKKLQAKELEAETAEEQPDTKLTVKQRIAKNKKSLKLNSEVSEAKQAILEEKHKVDEAIENASLTKKEALDEAEEAASNVSTKSARKA